MSAKVYKIASEEAALRYGQEIGAEAELDLPMQEERAVVAAGWLEPIKKKREV